MDDIIAYIVLFSIIVLIGHIFNKSNVPITLILVVTGMILSFVDGIPNPHLNPNVVLHIFLPILIYQISSFSSWKDFKKNVRPISLLSVGHVLFITLLIAIVIHTLIPQLGWPLAFVLGAVISPPDDVAIVTIAEKTRLPARIITILEGEGLLNDATALIVFRFSLAAALAHEFFLTQTLTTFLILIIAEGLYGLALGHLLGALRSKVNNTSLHMIASLLTPFLAYIPPLLLGSSGVLSTVIVGFLIGNHYAIRFSPQFRLMSRAIWPTLSFSLNCILFLLVGLNFRNILENVSGLPINYLALYSSAVILTIIIGRFFWVYVAVLFLPRFLFPSIQKKDPYPPWQYPFIISWAGMRGSISLAAATAVPLLPNTQDGINPRDLLIFLVFSVIAATFVIQGLTLPWLIKRLNIHKISQNEEYNEHLTELSARLAMTKAVVRWLKSYKQEITDLKQIEQIKIYLHEYQWLRNQLKERISDHTDHQEFFEHDTKEESKQESLLLTRIVEIEQSVLLELWRKEKISFSIRNKLISKLDHRLKHIEG